MSAGNDWALILTLQDVHLKSFSFWSFDDIVTHWLENAEPAAFRTPSPTFTEGCMTEKSKPDSPQSKPNLEFRNLWLENNSVRQ